MSLIAIAVLGIVLGFTWRLLRLAFRVALLIALIAAIANYGSHLSQHAHPAPPPRCNTAPSPHPDGHARLNPGAAGRLREPDDRRSRTCIPVCQLAGYRLMSRATNARPSSPNR